MCEIEGVYVHHCVCMCVCVYVCWFARPFFLRRFSLLFCSSVLFFFNLQCLFASLSNSLLCFFFVFVPRGAQLAADKCELQEVLSRQILSAASSTEALQSSLTASENRFAALKRAHDSAECQLLDVRNSAEESRKRMDEERTHREALAVECHRLRAQHSAEVSRLHECSAKLQQAVDRQEAAESECKRERQERTSAESLLQMQLTGCRQELACVVKAEESSKREVEDVSAALQLSKAQLSAEQRRLAEMQTERCAMDAARRDAELRENELKSETADLRVRLDAWEHAATSAQQRQTESQAELTAARSALDSVSAALHSAQSALTEQSAALSREQSALVATQLRSRAQATRVHQTLQEWSVRWARDVEDLGVRCIHSLLPYANRVHAVAQRVRLVKQAHRVMASLSLGSSFAHRCVTGLLRFPLHSQLPALRKQLLLTVQSLKAIAAAPAPPVPPTLLSAANNNGGAAALLRTGTRTGTRSSESRVRGWHTRSVSAATAVPHAPAMPQSLLLPLCQSVDSLDVSMKMKTKKEKEAETETETTEEDCVFVRGADGASVLLPLLPLFLCQRESDDTARPPCAPRPLPALTATPRSARKPQSGGGEQPAGNNGSEALYCDSDSDSDSVSSSGEESAEGSGEEEEEEMDADAHMDADVDVGSDVAAATTAAASSSSSSATPSFLSVRASSRSVSSSPHLVTHEAQARVHSPQCPAQWPLLMARRLQRFVGDIDKFEASRLSAEERSAQQRRSRERSAEAQRKREELWRRGELEQTRRQVEQSLSTAESMSVRVESSARMLEEMQSLCDERLRQVQALSAQLTQLGDDNKSLRASLNACISTSYQELESAQRELRELAAHFDRQRKESGDREKTAADAAHVGSLSLSIYLSLPLYLSLAV